MDEILKFTAKPHGKSVAKALEKEGRATAATLMKLTDKPITSVRDALKLLYGKSKIHVGGYELNGRGKVLKVWYWGDGDDVREPVMNKDKSVFVPHADVAAAWLRNPIC
jgi:hypothetical protein